MRLGIVGMLPGDLRNFNGNHFETIRELGFTGAGFHLPGELLDEISGDDTARCRRLFTEHDVDLAQFAITYGDCLFDPDPEARSRAVSKVVGGAALAARLGADCYLIRPGSLNPAGPWTPHRANHTPQALALLIRTLREIAHQTEGTEHRNGRGDPRRFNTQYPVGLPPSHQVGQLHEHKAGDGLRQSLRIH